MTPRDARPSGPAGTAPARCCNTGKATGFRYLHDGAAEVYFSCRWHGKTSAGVPVLGLADFSKLAANVTCPSCKRVHDWAHEYCAPGAAPDSAPVIPSRPEIGALPTVEHPGPWKWGDNGDDNLRDANGECLIGSESGAWPADERVRALTEAAPEMEALLRIETAICARRADWDRDQRDMGDRRDWDGLEAVGDEPPPDCGVCRPCRRRELLARIDAASRT